MSAALTCECFDGGTDLVEEDEEDDVVAEARKAVKERHLWSQKA